MHDQDTRESGLDPHDERDESPEVDALRALWGALEAPSPDDSDAEPGVSRDPLADEAVRRLKAAWVQLAAPPAELPWRLRRRRVAPMVGALAAAALVLAAVAIGLARHDEQPREEPVADVGDEPVTAHDATNETAPIEEPLSPPPHVERAQPHGEIDAGGRLVLHSGSVRLMWLEPAPAPRAENTQS